MKIFVVIFLFISLCSCKSRNDFKEPAKEADSTISEGRSLSFLIDSLKIDKKSLKILIRKTAYELSVWSGSIEIKKYRVVFGKNPADDKLMQGDCCTPEGTFKIKMKYPHRLWSKFISLDYPNKESWEKHKKAKREGKIPEKADIGGDIGIHGVPEGYDYAVDCRQNWTLGCISLKNKDINELYEFVNINTVVKIEK
jgi:murein L,D-transpeptidase YafK